MSVIVPRPVALLLIPGFIHFNLWAQENPLVTMIVRAVLSAHLIQGRAL